MLVRSQGVPVVHVRQQDVPSVPVAALACQGGCPSDPVPLQCAQVRPGSAIFLLHLTWTQEEDMEPVVVKSTFDAFFRTDLDECLQ